MPNSNSHTAPGILALNWYFARSADLVAEVLATRLRACDVRERLGIPTGRVLRRISGNDELPDVVWDCPFESPEDHDADMAVRAASAEFEAVRARMRALTRRFERVLYALGPRDLALSHASPDRQLSTQHWVYFDGAVQNDMPLSGARRRIGNAVTLPDWIIETPDDASQRPMQLASGVHASVISSRWERVR